MTLLFDQSLGHRLVDRLADLCPDSTQARLAALARATDAAPWDHGARGGHALIPRGVDLAEMAALRGPPPLVIWLRGGDGATAAVEAVLRRHHAEIVAAATSGDVARGEVW